MIGKGNVRGSFTFWLAIAAIGVAAYGLFVPRICSTCEQARPTAAQADIKGGIKAAIDQYEVDNGSYPKSLPDLVKQSDDAKNWRGPYFNPPNLPIDPWGNYYIYYFPGKHNQSSYDLFSVGPDGKAGTEDDIDNWKK